MSAGVQATILTLQGRVGLHKTPEVERCIPIVAPHRKLNIFVRAHTSAKGTIALQRGINCEDAANAPLVLFDGRKIHARSDIWRWRGIYNRAIICAC